MKISTDRILTTHVGSLPRPPDLLAMIEAREAGQEFDEAAFAARLADAVREVVAKQVACGIDSACDGEQSKISYTFYVRHRLSGIGTFRGAEVDKPPQTGAHRDLLLAAIVVRSSGCAPSFRTPTLRRCQPRCRPASRGRVASAPRPASRSTSTQSR